MSERQRFGVLLRACSWKTLILQGQQIHAAVEKSTLKSDIIVNNGLINMYGKCNRLDTAHAVFDRMLQRNSVSWNSLMSGHLQQNDSTASLHLFVQMLRSGTDLSEYTLTTNLKASAVLGILHIGMQIHAICAKRGFDHAPAVSNSILFIYMKFGNFRDAHNLFAVMQVKNVVTWNTMISGYTKHGHNEVSLQVFREMKSKNEIPDEFTFTSTLKSCSGLKAIKQGIQIHAFLITIGFPYTTIGTFVACALIDLYVKCGDLSMAQKIFNQIGHKSEKRRGISWSSLVLGYAQRGELLEAMNLFAEIRKSSLRVDEFMVSSMLGAFADFTLLEQGKQMHCYAIKAHCSSDLPVANSCINMYLKCGSLEEGEKYFRLMKTKNLVSWTVMISGYGKFGDGKKAISLFVEMQEIIAPDEVTYLALLSACSHSGLVDECQKYFAELIDEKGLSKPRMEHYACMVDVLGRSGRLNEAKRLIDSMPFEPNPEIWRTLLGSCRVHGNFEMGKKVGEIVLKHDNPVAYVTMSNLFTDAGRWKESEDMRLAAKSKGIQKDGGCSWVEVGKEVHVFYSGDATHPMTDRICDWLKEMNERLKEEMGYVCDVRFSSHDVEEESKKESLGFHSEKLAMGFAMVCEGKEVGVIRIFKNLRVCGDCHEFMKGVSLIVKRVFLVRDANRFHRFENGVCSCADFW